MTLIECQPELDIAAGGDLRQRLLAALQTGESVELDASAVRKTHTAILQLLLSAFTEARALGVPMHWRNPSPALLEGACLLGLLEGLDLAGAAAD